MKTSPLRVANIQSTNIQVACFSHQKTSLHETISKFPSFSHQVCKKLFLVLCFLCNDDTFTPCVLRRTVLGAACHLYNFLPFLHPKQENNQFRENRNQSQIKSNKVTNCYLDCSTRGSCVTMLVLATSLPFFLLFFLYKTTNKIVTCTNNLGKTQIFYLDCSCISMEVLPTSLTFLFFFSLQNKYCNLTKTGKK